MDALRPILRKTEIKSFGYGFEAIYHVFVGAREFKLSAKFDDFYVGDERWRRQYANAYLYVELVRPDYDSMLEAFEDLSNPTAYETSRKEAYLLELSLDPSQYYTDEQCAKAEEQYVKAVEKARKNHKALSSIYC